MFVKICGTTSVQDAQLAIAAGADAVGFVFAPSKRQVSVEQVAEITATMPEGIQRVGVFTTMDAGDIILAAREARLTAVQLHMPQVPNLLAALEDRLPGNAKIWQVVSFATDSQDVAGSEQKFQREVLEAMAEPRIAAVLLDTAKSGVSGGTGTSFPWQRAAALVRQAITTAKQLGANTKLGPTPVIIAGGLHAENVAEAIGFFTPWGVDCVSGVEAEPGRKDRRRLEAFVKSARGER